MRGKKLERKGGKTIVWKISNLSVPLGCALEEIKSIAAKRMKIPVQNITTFRIAKRSVDARKKTDVHFVYTLEFELKRPFDGPLPPGVAQVAKRPEICLPTRQFARRPVVVGSGPAGLFCALQLARSGANPILLERGNPVDERAKDVDSFWKTGQLNPDSNVQFGEGGAGTFSDGKLNTGTKDPRIEKVLFEMVQAGAPEAILWEAKPHIGTDLLRSMVKKLREEIIRLGGEVRFREQMVGFRTKQGKLVNLDILRKDGSHYELETEDAVLAIGHSARDTFAMLLEQNVAMEAKPFSVGVRIEHLQQWLDKTQYGRSAGHPALGAADYKLAVHLKNGRGVYTFCMCPGGFVVAAASEPGRVVTNGMSFHARDGKNANSALLVGVDAKDFGQGGPLAGVMFQRRLEERAFQLGGGGFRAPAQRVGDFLAGKATKRFGGVTPSYRPGVVPSDLQSCFPQEITDSLRMGILEMDRFLHGFAKEDAVLTGVESRSSSPVRILRSESCQSVSVSGLYPCGEGAGYAGGIVSAAVDGLRCAEAVLKKGK